MILNNPTKDSLVKEASTIFQNTFSTEISISVCAPGRVNLIGEHTDYNDGYVLPMAMPLVTIIVGRKSSIESRCRIKSASVGVAADELVSFHVPSEDSPLVPSEPPWANYVKGVLSNFHRKVVGFDAVIVSSVPLGGGLSSSASLEVAMYTFLEALMDSKAPSLKSKALACQKAEHDFAHVPCGIMDQFISVMGQEGSALLIDCRSLESTCIPFVDPKVAVVVIDSKVRHTLTGSEYPSRRKNCFDAAEIMKKRSLRDASLQELDDCKGKIDDVLFRRARHVITEIERTKNAAEALRENNYVTFGRLMNESHESLRSDYEVSCQELDELVSIALSVPGVLGSRMTGAGFGGCTVTLVNRDSVDDLVKAVECDYGRPVNVYVCSPSGGAKVLLKSE